jgi:RNA polymerase primary sigma factor/RNA polymerase nonessential primary-like sigma factor
MSGGGRATERGAGGAGEHGLLRPYFREIGGIRVLTAAEEAELARGLRTAERELAAVLEPLPATARALLSRWEALRAQGRVTGQLSGAHEPPARDRSASVDRSARRIARLLRRRDALGAGDAAARARVGRELCASVRAVGPPPELFHEILDELRALGPGADASVRAALPAAEAAEARARACKDTFVRHNLRLVVHQAKGFRNAGVPFPDLIQEGTLGLIRAVEKFDERLGNRFSTYAIWWIQQSCMRAIQQGARTVRLPAPVQDQLRRYRRAVERLSSRRAEPRANEVARELGLATAAVEGLAKLDRPVLRLDDPLPGRERVSFADRLAADTESADDPDRMRIERAAAELLERLPRRERSILRARFGFADGEEHTLQEVGAELGISRERVRQLEKRALARLAAAARAAGLEEAVCSS